MGAGSVAFFHESHVHADAVSAAPLDDNSVAALTSLDHAMESLAARVTPAVVNVAVTSKAEAQEAECRDERARAGQRTRTCLRGFAAVLWSERLVAVAGGCR